jgi:hypothetical protein
MRFAREQEKRSQKTVASKLMARRAVERAEAREARKKARESDEGNEGNDGSDGSDGGSDGGTGSENRLAMLARAVESKRRQPRRPTRERALKVEKVKVRSSTGFERGDLVSHASFGEGEVVRIKGDTIVAFFPGVGEKLLKARFLDKVGD